MPRHGTYFERLLNGIEEVGEKECWRRPGKVSDCGYSRIGNNYEQFLAHRIIYELMVEKIPDELQIDHICRNRWCVNPGHMEPVTIGENLRRSELTLPGANIRKTHCPQGHPLVEGNILRDKKTGKRKCRECACARLRARSKRVEAVRSKERKATPLSRDFRFISPEGEAFFKIENLKEFCDVHNLNYKGMSKLHRGDSARYKGWKKYESLESRQG